MKTDNQLLAVAQSNDQSAAIRATEDMLSRYAKLVHRITRRYYRPGMHLEYDDISQTARVGLLLAIRNFDLTLGKPFGGYACNAIHNRVRRCIQETGRDIYLPAWLTKQLNRIKRERERITITLGHPPNNAELAKALRMSEENLRELLTVPMAHMSLDESNGYDESDASDTIGEEVADNVSDFAADVALKMLLEEVMTKVPNGDVLDMRFRQGLELNEIAARTGYSEAAVRRWLDDASHDARVVLRQEMRTSDDNAICGMLLG